MVIYVKILIFFGKKIRFDQKKGSYDHSANTGYKWNEL
jgi:hypothetical protein